MTFRRSFDSKYAFRHSRLPRRHAAPRLTFSLLRLPQYSLLTAVSEGRRRISDRYRLGSLFIDIDISAILFIEFLVSKFPLLPRYFILYI